MLLPNAARSTGFRSVRLSILAALAPALAAVPSSEDPDPATRALAVSELDELLELAIAGDTTSPQSVDDVLAAVAPSAAGAFVGALESHVLRAMAGVRSDSPAERPSDSPPLGEVPALRALVLTHPARTLAALTSAQAAPAERFHRIDVAFAILIADGDSAQLGVADALAGLRITAPEGAREARRLLEAALDTALRRDEFTARRELARVYPGTTRGLEAAYADALRRVPSVDRLSALVGLLGLRSAGDGVLLNRAHSLALRLGAVLDESDLRILRRYLTAVEPFERVGAAQTVGALEDRGALPTLIDLLRDQEPSVRNASHDALRSISAMTIGPSPDRWGAWLAREERWWHGRGVADLGRLDVAEPPEALRILREAAQHRLFRSEIAAATQPLLFCDDTALVRMALATLESVRARGCELDIVELLEHSSSSVRAQAAEALRSLTGQVLPGDPRLWRQVLRP